jgi:hypothetical protein
MNQSIHIFQQEQENNTDNEGNSVCSDLSDTDDPQDSIFNDDIEIEHPPVDHAEAGPNLAKEPLPEKSHQDSAMSQAIPMHRAAADIQRVNDVRIQCYLSENERQQQLHEMKMEESRQATLRSRVRAEADAAEARYWQQRALDEEAVRRRTHPWLATLLCHAPLPILPSLSAEAQRLLSVQGQRQIYQSWVLVLF